MNTYEKELINEFFRDIREFKKKVLEKTNNTFNISFIKYIKDNQGNNINTKRFTLKKTFFGKNLDKVIFNNKIYYKNREKFENIYISLDNTNEKTNLLWLDDIKLNNFTQQQLKYMTLVETSENNYQAFIILNKEITKEELKQVKLYFCKNYKTDRGSVDFTHLMRLPYFYSYKHEQPHYITVKQYQEKLLNIQPILNKIKINKSNTIQQPKQPNKIINKIDENELKKIYDKYIEIKKEELTKIDYSTIDYRFLHYLHYYTNINIKSINFKSILYNINERKKGHIDDYIQRTINKVITNTNYKNIDIPILNSIKQETN